MRMETVEVVVRLPKESYDILKNNEDRFSGSRIYDCILKGTVLPKGHGRLFILDEELVKEFFTSFSFSCQKWISEVDISKATLKVIEADKEEKNETTNAR